MPSTASRVRSTRTVTNRNVSPLRLWLTEFLFIREFYRQAPGIALYRYHVTPNEFRELGELLREYRDHAVHPTYGASWAPAFCLFVAEKFRREYDARTVSWAWAPFENAIGCSFTQQQHSQLVRHGLEYWKRPVRKYDGGRDNLLGSLFTEGGLPWPLVQRETHGFGRVVGKGLKYHYRTEAGLRTMPDLLADFVHELPQTFHDSPETLRLLAGIVEQLMALATRYELRGKEDPARYLDTVEPDWRYDFPLPLDEDNARGLINDWLRDASRRREEREAQQASAGTFFCGHRLIEEPHGWCIRTEVSIPRLAELSVDTLVGNLGRLELAFFEGDRLLARAGVAYGARRDNAQDVSVRFIKTQFSLNRVRLGDELTLRLLANGSVACIVRFDHGAIDADELPLVFELKGDEWWFLASASCTSAASRVRVRLPRGLDYRCEGAVDVREETSGQVRWIETAESLQVFFDNGDRYAIELRSTLQSSRALALKGVNAHYDSVPQVVYQGWPRMDTGSGSACTSTPAAMPAEFVNRARVTRSDHSMLLGAVHYSARDAGGNILLQRRFGVVPPGFSINAFAGSGGKPARLVVQQSRQLEIQVVDSRIHSQIEVQGSDTVIWLKPQNQVIPSFVTLEVRSSAGGLAPIRFRVAYPYEGARLIGADGATIAGHDLTLADLLGLRVALSTSLTGGKRFCLQLELVSGEERCTRHYYIGVCGHAVLLSLFSYQTDMLQMLGAVDDQDAFLRVSVETDRPLLNFRVRRYNGAHRYEDASTFAIMSLSHRPLQAGVVVEAMLLTDPKQASVEISELTTQDVGTGRFRTPPSMRHDGPWLIYPACDSPTQFRPFLHKGEEAPPVILASEIHSLHAAARAYHPVTQRHVIAQQINAMAKDFDHSGWQYLADLKQHYAHLPLSVFEAWLALSRDPAALAAAVFRLEVDETFCARIRDELAVIWECVPLPQWSAAYRQYRDWLDEQGLPLALSASVLHNRRQMLPHVLDGYGEAEMGRYLETADAASLRAFPIEMILPTWFQQLRRTHDGNDHWPTELGHALREWLARQKLPPPVLTLSEIEYTDAVAIMPIFMGYVTAGLASFDDLKRNRSSIKYAVRLVSDFDRFNWYAPAHGLMVSYLLATQK